MIDSASGRLSRVVAMRLAPGDDLFLGIEETCRKYGIKNGVILSGIGSLRNAKFFDPVELPETKSGYGYSEAIEEEGPIELISASGAICTGPDGDVLLHVHCCFADSSGRAFAGHLIEGNTVLLTADVTIAEYEGILMDRRFDEELGVPIVRPRQLQQK